MLKCTQIMESKKRDIYERIYKFALSCIEHVRSFPNTLEANIIAKQLIRSATSIGANAEEADGSESKAEFIHRFSIAKKESKETSYWLHISEDALHKPAPQLRQEAYELVSIISTIIAKVKNKRLLEN